MSRPDQPPLAPESYLTAANIYGVTKVVIKSRENVFTSIHVDAIEARRFVELMSYGTDKNAEKNLNAALTQLASRPDVLTEIHRLTQAWTLTPGDRRAAIRAKLNSLAFDPSSEPKIVLDAIKLISRDEGIGEQAGSVATFSFSPELSKAAPVLELPDAGYIDVEVIEKGDKK